MIPEMPINTRFKIKDSKYDAKRKYIVVGPNELGGVYAHDENENGRGNPNERTIHCFGRIPLEAMFARGVIKIIDPAKNIDAVENALEFLPDNAPIPMDLAINGVVLAGQI